MKSYIIILNILHWLPSISSSLSSPNFGLVVLTPTAKQSAKDQTLQTEAEMGCGASDMDKGGGMVACNFVPHNKCVKMSTEALAYRFVKHATLPCTRTKTTMLHSNNIYVQKCIQL